ncbi:hypothetical protein LJB77_01830 [Ruminococcaceae bacterium OttesenSCG-928-N02]|nr:hypothetical protein [Ruminococcaceae bacterium OttesenSCG-928-N02]
MLSITVPPKAFFSLLLKRESDKGNMGEGGGGRKTGENIADILCFLPLSKQWEMSSHFVRHYPLVKPLASIGKCTYTLFVNFPLASGVAPPNTPAFFADSATNFLSKIKRYFYSP